MSSSRARTTTVDDAERMPRCCPRHDDWPTMCLHLEADFVDIESRRVRHEVAQARLALDRFAVDLVEQLDIAETIVRHRLMVETGCRPDSARCMPETHTGRTAVALDGVGEQPTDRPEPTDPG